MAPNQLFYLIGVVIQLLFGMLFVYLSIVAKRSAQQAAANGANQKVVFVSWALTVLIFLIGVALIVHGFWSLGHMPKPNIPGL